uniref:PspC domain-containing protein n=1 Tax=Polaribacter sp. TaxID=1920175 RepID=UPI004048AF32
MNKTININLGGFFFHIDETAFQKLKRYLDAIARSLSDDPQGKNEIISDIEARISELLSEKITDARQVVNEGDIDEVIKIMGQPEDYAEAEEGYANEGYSYQQRKSSSKKLFRDGDDKFLGGVASGIAHYFDVDTVWIRLAFILFAFSGFSIVTYIILWIVIPQAETTAEKLQMQGEDVTIDNIEKKIREEFSNVSEKIRNSADEVTGKLKDGAKNINDNFKKGGKKASSGLQDFLDTLGAILLTLFKVFGKFIGVILMIASAVTLISLIIGAFSVGSIDYIFGLDNDFAPISSLFFESTLPSWLLTVCVFLLIGIPVLSLFILGLRIVSSNVKQFSKVTSLTFLAIWILAFLAILFTGIEFSSSKAFDGNKLEKKELSFANKDTLNIKMIKNNNLYYQSSFRRRDNRNVIHVNDLRKVFSNNVRIDVEKSPTNTAYVEIRKTSEGRNIKRANESAAEMMYNFDVDSKDLLFDNYFLSPYKNLIKSERIYITLFIPEGMTVYFDESTQYYLYQVDNTTDTYDSDMGGRYFTMTSKGLHNKELATQESFKSDED